MVNVLESFVLQNASFNIVLKWNGYSRITSCLFCIAAVIWFNNKSACCSYKEKTPWYVEPACQKMLWVNWKGSNYFEKSMFSWRIRSFDSFEVI